MMDGIYVSRMRQSDYCEDQLLEETKAKTKDLLTCPLCRQTYRDPRSLPCGDAFCLACLQRYIFGLLGGHQSLKLGSFTCPKCSAQIGLPPTGVSSFPKDNRVDEIREKAVEEMTRKLARERAARNGQNSGKIVESDSSDYIDLDINESKNDIHSDLFARSSRYSINRSSSSIINRIRPGYASVRESRGPGLRYSKSFTGGLRPTETESCSTSDLNGHVKEESNYSSELDDLREFVTPIIGRNRTGYSSLRDRRRRSEIDENHSVLNAQFFEPRTRIQNSNTNSYAINDLKSDTCSNTCKPSLQNRDPMETSDSSFPASNFDSEFSRKDNIKSDDRKRSSLIDSILADLTQGKDDANVESHLSRFRGIVRVGSLREPSTRSYKDIIRNAELRDDSQNYWDELRRNDSTFQNGSTIKNNEKRQDERAGIGRTQSITKDNHIGKDFASRQNYSSVHKNNDGNNYSNGSNADTSFETENCQNNNTANDSTVERNFVRESPSRQAYRINRRKRTPLSDQLFEEDKNNLLTSNSNFTSQNFEKGENFQFSEIAQKNIIANDNGMLTSENYQLNDMGSKSELNCTKISNSTDKLLIGNVQTENNGNDSCAYLSENISNHFGMISDLPRINSEHCGTIVEPSGVSSEHPSGIMSEVNPAEEGTKCYDEVISDIFDDCLLEHESENTEATMDQDSAMVDNGEGSDTLSAASEVQLDESGIIEYMPGSPSSSNDLETVDFGQSHPGVTEIENNISSDIQTTTQDESGSINQDRYSSANVSTNSNVRTGETDHHVQHYSDSETECNDESEDSHSFSSSNPPLNANSQNTNASGESNADLNNCKTSQSYFGNGVANFRRSRVDAGIPVNTGSAVLEEVRGGDCVSPTAVVSMENVSVVADYGGTKLQFLFEDGSPSHAITTLKPFSLAVSKDGDKVFVGDRKHRTVAVFDCYGSDVAQWESNIFPWISGIGIFRNGNLAILDRSKCSVGIYSAGGELLKEFGSYGPADTQWCMAEFLAVDSKDRIIVSDSGNHCVKIFSATGQFLGVCGRGRGTSDNGQLQWPKGVCTDEKDNIIVADCCNNRVSMFSSDGAFLEHLVTNIRYPYGVSYSPNRNQIFVTLQSMSRTNSYHAYSLSSSP